MENKIYRNVVFIIILLTTNTYIDRLINKVLFFPIKEDLQFLYISIIAISVSIYFLIFIAVLEYWKLSRIYLLLLSIAYVNNLYTSFILENAVLIVLFSILIVVMVYKFLRFRI